MPERAHGTSRGARFGTALGVVVVDQASKWWVVEALPLGERLPVVGPLELTHLRNTGAAFSMLHEAGGWQRWFFIVLAAVVSAGIVAWLWRRESEGGLLVPALVLILGGALGNLIDRLTLGYVVDFIRVWLGTWPFPAFNVADAAISVGAVLVLVDGWRGAPPAPGRD